jgi:hypothetical protein
MDKNSLLGKVSIRKTESGVKQEDSLIKHFSSLTRETEDRTYKLTTSKNGCSHPPQGKLITCLIRPNKIQGPFRSHMNPSGNQGQCRLPNFLINLLICKEINHTLLKHPLVGGEIFIEGYVV